MSIGYTKEGYAYTLVGPDKNIKLVSSTDTNEIFLYDFGRECQHCGKSKERTYAVSRKVIFDSGSHMIQNPLLFCPECFENLHDLFTGLEMNDT